MLNKSLEAEQMVPEQELHCDRALQPASANLEEAFK